MIEYLDGLQRSSPSIHYVFVLFGWLTNLIIAAKGVDRILYSEVSNLLPYDRSSLLYNHC